MVTRWFESYPILTVECAAVLFHTYTATKQGRQDNRRAEASLEVGLRLGGAMAESINDGKQ